ncbi:Fe-S cluster assembly protein NifU [Hydrococcus rivularis NIES-593]|uniref:Nitrogen fixation protein NifU n=1 Tax=Hydrococcus rivularis NIES-593 TaxID=1921803 RepID=A0A1U7HLN1_9CYAN|nr:Fe-S cluster assembly protein NifU [Hydrococcus rivularis]OKH24448.1 Fe-S cluster assembly protein NifU [Hydrococcus rivularis NIES-593]
MWDYTDIVMDHFYNPRNKGAITEAQEGERIVTGEVGSIACGDALRLHLKVQEATEIIIDSRFQTFGCTSAIASSSALTELLKGKTLDEALKITNKEIADFLGGLPEEKMHCSVMGQEALEAAIANYRGIPLENHDDDEGALLCRCFGVTDAKIRRVIIENNLTTAEQVTHYVKAGGGCGSCLADIDDIIADVLEQKEKAVAVATKVVTDKLATTQSGKPLTNLQKIGLIQQVLDSEIKPLLARDGGDVELFDVEGDRVLVVLQGACTSCSSSTETLKVAIEATLRDRVSPTLIVESV